MNTKISICCDGHEIEVDVEFDFDPGQHQTHWDPSYPPSVDIISVKLGGREIGLTKEETEELEERLCMQVVEHAKGDDSYWADRAFDEMRDERMLEGEK